ncbi:YlaI family protein [Camelliibacillus cellulosilyticus]|uniref:YlaI family protein n=1 Tax=Camelliibacillus cellulosilyticus TaxID=2174486 RepID=A0ABV9GIZ2_9BACL
MQAKCALCETVENLDDNSSLAKRLRNRPIHTFLCDQCRERITDRTIQRWETGKFRIPQPSKHDHW